MRFTRFFGLVIAFVIIWVAAYLIARSFTHAFAAF
jgi:hypothetical protein